MSWESTSLWQEGAMCMHIHPCIIPSSRWLVSFPLLELRKYISFIWAITKEKVITSLLQMLWESVCPQRVKRGSTGQPRPLPGRPLLHSPSKLPSTVLSIFLPGSLDTLHMKPSPSSFCSCLPSPGAPSAQGRMHWLFYWYCNYNHYLVHS